MKKFILSLMAITVVMMSLIFNSCKPEDSVVEPQGIAGSIGAGQTENLVAGTDYILDGPLIVEDGGVLNIAAGTVIKANKGFSNYILVLQGGKINVNGTAENPVRMTANAATATSGYWGGLIINGKAPLAGGSTGSTEVNSAYTYGGTVAADNSGTIKYLIIEYPGARSSADVEHNGLTLNGVGSGTVIENIYVLESADDAIEFFGGSVNVKNFLAVNPADIPDRILGQLGNRIQHALRAYTPNDQKAVKVAADTFRPNPKFKTETVITELQTGEALVSFLDEKGAPNPVERAFILPPEGQVGPITPEERVNLIKSSLLYGIYENDVDRISAFEIISEKMKANDLQKQQLEQQKQIEIQRREQEKAELEEEKRKRVEEKDDVFGGLLKNVGRTIGRQLTSQVGRAITRSILGTFFSKK